MIDDPWKYLAKPSAEPAITALRVDPLHPWGFFWAKDSDGRCLLVFRHSSGTDTNLRLPRLRGLEVGLVAGSEGGSDVFVLRLLDGSLRDVFLTLCTDVVHSTQAADSERGALEIAVRRTWRWHHLLRGGSDGRLTAEEQKGLIGELLVLEKCLLPLMRALDAVRSWTGPEGTPKDFQVGQLCIEAKARRGSAAPEVAISSEHQLDSSGIDALFLHVVNLGSSPADGGGSSVADIAERIRADLRTRDSLAAEAFEERLEAAGLDPTHDYSDSLWLEGESWVYSVSDGFPRIGSSGLIAGVSRVRYSISLADCRDYRCELGALAAAIEAVAGHVE